MRLTGSTKGAGAVAAPGWLSTSTLGADLLVGRKSHGNPLSSCQPSLQRCSSGNLLPSRPYTTPSR
eukprot:5148012-Amphidinium_carterae.2